MKVDLIASTIFHDYPAKEVTGFVWDVPYACSADALGEFAGRACYQSWDRPNPKTAKNRDYLANVINQGHESVLAHASATFYIQGVSRSLTHELIRHRWLTFSEVSQRYVDMGSSEFVIPPALIGYEAVLLHVYKEAIYTYEHIVNLLSEEGLSRKEAREAARAVLPGMTETKIVVSGNIRAWRDFLRQRLSPHADAEIRELAQEIYRQLKNVAPNSMQGIEDL